jgi:hypothetical protein
MPNTSNYFDNVTIGQFVLTGVPVKVYVDGTYLTITDPDDIEDSIYGFGIDDDGAVHNFDYRMIDHLLVANQHLDFETYKKAMEPKAPAAPAPAAEKKPEEEKTETPEEPKKEESVMKLKSLIKNNVLEDVAADKKKLVDLKKQKTKLAKDIATLTLSVADEEAKAAEAGVTENSITSLSEPYTINVGDMIQNTNTSCQHYGSTGIVQSVTALPDDMGVVAKYVVTNSGDTYAPGDILTKTIDQLEPMDYEEEDYDDMSDEMDDWDVTMADGLDDDDYVDYEEEDEDYEEEDED